jgi:hypothetical protein
MKRDWLDNLIGFALASLCIAALVQCGNSNNTKKTIVFTTTPSPSIVIESDYVETLITTTGTAKSVLKGPWTYWNYQATNVSTSTITVYTIHYDGSAMGKQFKGDVTTLGYALFTLAPGESYSGKSVIYALPSRDQINLLNYYFHAKAIGWYGPVDNPQKSFKTTFSFRASE